MIKKIVVFLMCITSLFSVYPAEIAWKGAVQTLLSESDFQLRYRALLPIAESIPGIGHFFVALFPKAKHEYKAYRGYEAGGKRKFGLQRFLLHHIKSAIFSPFSFSVNGANHLLFSVCRFVVDYTGARLQDRHTQTENLSPAQEFFVIQALLLSGITARTEKLTSITANHAYLFEHFCGMILQNGLIMFFVTKALSPLLKKLPLYKRFDRFLKYLIQKPTIKALNQYIFDPIIETFTITKRKFFNS